jgi:hypothetical protein
VKSPTEGLKEEENAMLDAIKSVPQTPKAAAPSGITHADVQIFNAFFHASGREHTAIVFADTAATALRHLADLIDADTGASVVHYVQVSLLDLDTPAL